MLLFSDIIFRDVLEWLPRGMRFEKNGPALRGRAEPSQAESDPVGPSRAADHIRLNAPL